ncbi:MAG: AAA family ATPase [Balneolaceae bacterium]
MINYGTTWHRWEPHIHTPETLLNDQFTSGDPWEDYYEIIEKSEPRIRAIGITDYYLIGNYEKLLLAKSEGRLPDVELIFPNIELRLDVATQKGKWVNIHFLVDPSDQEHIIQVKRLLARLNFRAYNDTFACTPKDLTRLGKTADQNIEDNQAALRYGATQFKASFDQLREEFDKSGWAKKNIIIAIAGSKTDGTSGVREASDTTLREEMESFANVIFASSIAQREFWLGLRSLDEQQIITRYGGLKPCLHGSDGHDFTKSGTPDNNRYSWVKGGIEFDSLKQACIDPHGRAFVGISPPETGIPSQSIDRIQINGASWAKTPIIGFNPGLVSIIGARGSGKTALADMIAMACDAIHEAPRSEDSRLTTSFIKRAKDLLGDIDVAINWRSGDSENRALDGTTTPDVKNPRVRYLSQQFVEDLCSSDGLTDELLNEVERVIFESHSLTEQDGALNFSELLELRSSRLRQAREREEEAIIQLSDRIGSELEKNREIPKLKEQIAQKKKKIKAYKEDRSKLVTKGSEKRVERLNDLTTAAEKIRSYIRFFKNQEQALLGLRDEVKDLRNNKAPEMLRQSKERHSASRMNPEDWKTFLLDYTGDVDQKLSALLKNSRDSIKGWRGTKPEIPESPEIALIKDNEDLEKQSLTLLEAEIKRLEKLVSADINTQRKYAALSKSIISESTKLENLEEKLSIAQGAQERIKNLQKEREEAYKRIFDAVESEENVLKKLYKPLMKKIASKTGTITKLSFTVSRNVNIDKWSKLAEEELVDLRRQGPFRGKGNLKSIVEDTLEDAWGNGDSDAVIAAMSQFRELYQSDLLAHSNVPKGDQNDYRAWLKRFAKWLFSTDHIKLNYSLDYDGVDIRKLSPGTRGIVLLLLYLALDDADDRPLIIDQPEENLDPQSVFDELVELFIKAKSKRQVIMVTHNANLVVNTDSDQVIIANAEPNIRGKLPDISYKSGGLENEEIRKAVCDILEGGEHAFRERARRLRINMSK